MSENPLDLILQSIPHQYNRWLFDLPQYLLRVDIVFKLTDVEDEMDPPTWGQIQSKWNWSHYVVNAKWAYQSRLNLRRKLGQYVCKFVVDRTISSPIVYSSVRLFLSTAHFIRCCTAVRLDCASTSAVFIRSSASLTASLETLGSPLANNVFGTRGWLPWIK